MTKPPEPAARAGVPPRRGRKGAAPSPRLHLGRLLIIALVLIGAAFYVQPLRDFFAQQDRYQREVVALQAARRDNAALTREAGLLATRTYVAERARSEAGLVPPDTQLFMISGLPADHVARSTDRAPSDAGSLSILGRLSDLWQTLLH